MDKKELEDLIIRACDVFNRPDALEEEKDSMHWELIAAAEEIRAARGEGG